MLLLVFRVGRDRYALDAASVIEIVPVVPLHGARGPAGVAGLFNYRGAAVPALDLTEILTGRPAERRLSTRLVIVGYPWPSGARPLGVIAERCTAVVRRPRESFVTAELSDPETPFLGAVATSADGLLQLVDVASLVPPPMRERLFAGGSGA
jgi:chemotaxis-related protein WspB